MPESSGSLSEVAYVGRQGVKFGVILIVVLIVGRTLLSAALTYYRAVNPPPPPPPTVGFGLLPPLLFPSQQNEDRPQSYSLELATGQFPSFPDRAKVMLMLKTAPSLLDDEQTKQIGAVFGFIFPPQVTGTQYRFDKNQPIAGSLTVDSVRKSIDLQTDFISHPELLGTGALPDQNQATNQVKSLLANAQLLQSDIATASSQVTFLKVLGDQVSPALSFSDADIVRLSLHRYPIDGIYQTFTPDLDRGLIEADLSGALSGTDGLIRLLFSYQVVDYAQFHTYPLRPVQEAWKLLQAGEGYIAYKGNLDQAVVRSVALGYYDSFQDQDYLQPIYVFSGDGGFLGYVPAIDPQFTSKSTGF